MSLINSQIPQTPRLINPQMNNLAMPLLPGNMVWVKGKTEALNYPVPRGVTTPIFDQDADDIFYLKSVDVYGNTYPLRSFRYEEIVEETASAANSQPGVSVEEFNELKGQLASLQESIKNLSAKPNGKYESKKPYRKDMRSDG